MGEASQKKILIVIPTYNEKENIENLIRQILDRYLPEAHILVIEDNSPDGTGQIVDRLVVSNPQVHVVHRSGKLGFGSAYKMAFHWGLDQGFDVIYQMDADFSHDPPYLRPFFDEIKGDAYDGVIGSRYVSGGGTEDWGILREIISRGGGIYTRLLLGTSVRDMTGGFNAWSRKLLEGIDFDQIKSEGFSFQIELKYRAWKRGFRLKEYPIVFKDRFLGKSKMSSKIFKEAIWRVAVIGVTDKIGLARY